MCITDTEKNNIIGLVNVINGIRESSDMDLNDYYDSFPTLRIYLRSILGDYLEEKVFAELQETIDEYSLTCDKIVKAIEKVELYEKAYKRKFVEELCHKVMNLGMTHRQDQLGCRSDRSGNEVLEEFLAEHLK